MKKDDDLCNDPIEKKLERNFASYCVPLHLERCLICKKELDLDNNVKNFLCIKCFRVICLYFEENNFKLPESPEILISVDKYEMGYFYSFEELYNFFSLLPQEIILRCLLPEKTFLKSLISNNHHLEK